MMVYNEESSFKINALETIVKSKVVSIEERLKKLEDVVFFNCNKRNVISKNKRI